MGLDIQTPNNGSIGLEDKLVTVGGEVRVKNSDESYDQTFEPVDSPVTLPDSEVTLNGTTVDNAIPSAKPTAKEIAVVDSADNPVSITVINSSKVQVPDPADFGETIGTQLQKQYANPAFEVFGLTPFTDRALTADIVYLERGGDGATDLVAYDDIINGNVASWMSLGDGSAKIVNWLGHYGTGLIAYNNITSQQWEIGTGGVIHTDTQGNPTALCINPGGYFVGAAGGPQELPLLNTNGSFLFAGKKANTTTISRLFTVSGNPSIGIADTTSNPTDLNGGTPTTYVGNVALAAEQRDNLQAAMNGTEAIVFIENVDWTDSANWRLSSALNFLNNFQAGSQATLFGISINPLNAQRTAIFNAVNSNLNYHP